MAALAMTSRAHADTIVYQDTTTQVGAYVFNGAASVSGDLTGNIDINELTLAAGSAGETITSLSVQVLNGNSSAVSARSVMYIWAGNGVGGLPGTLLATLEPIFIGLGGLQTGTVDVSTSLAVPAGMELWVGLGYDNGNGATPITAAELDNLGGVTYFPPTVGTAGTTAYFLPPGSGLTDPSVIPFNTTGTGDYGWTITAAVPEPDSLALVCPLVLLIGAAGWLRIHRQTRRP